MITNVDDLVGNPSAQPKGAFIDAEKVQGVPVDNTSIGNGKALVYDSTLQKLVYKDVASGGSDVVVKSVNGKTGVVVITKSDIGLGNVQNVSSYSMTETNNLLNTKVSKVVGKDLSDNNYTSTDKSKVDKIITTNTGTKYLSDDGTYKDVTVTSGVVSVNSKTGIVDINKSDIGLSAVENIAPLDMPINNDTQTALNNKVDKEVGLGLSENNLTNSLKSSYDSAVENSHTHTNKLILDNIINTGLGDKYLSDDGTYKTVEGSGAETFLQLTDTPTSYTGEVGKFVRVKIDGTGLEFANVGGGGEGVDNFLELTDTPNTYIGQANKVISVNSTESSIEFTDLIIPSRTSDLTNDSSFVTDNNYVHTDNNYTTTEKTKLSGIEENANNYVLPSNVVIDENYVHTDTNYTQIEKTKLLGIMDGAEVNIQADWDTTDVNDDSFIKNKPTIADSFLELDDTPTSYSGNADKVVAVNSTGTGLTFVDGGSEGFTPIQMYKPINSTNIISVTDSLGRSGIGGTGAINFRNINSVHQGGICVNKLSPTLYDVSFHLYITIPNSTTTAIPSSGTYTLSIVVETGLGATFSSLLNRKLPSDTKQQYQGGAVATSSVSGLNGSFYITNGKLYIKYSLLNQFSSAKGTYNFGMGDNVDNYYSGRMTLDIGTGDLTPLAL